MIAFTDRITLDDIEKVLYAGEKIQVSPSGMERVDACYRFLEGFAAEKVIYGINTGFGPMAQWRVDDKYLADLQYNIIRSHAAGAGEPLPDIYVKSAMIARLGTVLQCRSGVHTDVVQLLVDFINNGIYPFIPVHGSVGASGDLVQLAHLALCLIGEGEVRYKGEWRSATEVMQQLGLTPLKMRIREGLSLTNGTSVMTGISVINQFHAETLLDWATLAAVWMNEIASSFDDYMSEGENNCRRHEGQQVMARRMRELSVGSQCLKKRDHELYGHGHSDVKVFEHKVQAYYSLRCTPQILGPIHDTLKNTRQILEDEINSACDNPIIDPEAGNVYHGGNFHGDYISLEEDKVKIALVRLCMTAERQLNYLFHDRINGILPPFLNLGALGLNYGMQACQFTATSTTAECQTLAMPNYVHSIPNNNDNQDIVSMGANTALICRQVVENCFQVLAIQYIALAQASDCLNIAGKLSPAARKAYDWVRGLVPLFIEDAPFYKDIAAVENHLKTSPLKLK